MKPQEFVIWLRGFTEGCNPYNVTPSQWDTLNEVLSTVEDDISVDKESKLNYSIYNTPIGSGSFGNYNIT